MQIAFTRFSVTKRHPLTISRGTSAGSDNLLVEVSGEGVVGWGEMAPVSIDETPETVATAERDLAQWSEALAGVSPYEMQRIEEILARFPGGSAARAALDLALHDWVGQRLGVPVWKLFGLNLADIPPTSVTIGINPPEVIRERIPEILKRTGARFLKVKLGSPDGIEADKAIFTTAQEAADRPVGWRVDANGGWNVPDAIRMISWLAEREVEFVEQPLARGLEAALLRVHSESSLPIYADESVRVAKDIPPLADRVDGVNLKLMKCGGLREGLRIIHTARAHGLKVMFGCMSETSLAITAAAHLSPLADALDLDSHLNLLPDPFTGAALVEGHIVPNDLPGLGVRRSAS